MLSMCIIKMKLCGSIALAVGILIGLGHRAEGFVSAAVAVGLIQAGGSFLGPALPWALSGDAKIKVNITVENWTRFPMTNPSIRAVGGVVDMLPTDIEPATKEILVASKTRFTATGSYGTVSWLVSGHKQRIVVMWSVPYDYNLYSNWLAVAVMNGATHPEGGKWFDKMYNDYDSPYNNFSRKKFRRHLDDLVFSYGDFKIVARMGNAHKTQVTVEVRPWWDADLAPTLRAALR